MLVAGIGAAQRIIALRTARGILVRDPSSEHGKITSRAMQAAIAEAIAWGPAMLAAVGTLSGLPAGIGGPAEEFLIDLWFGASVLSCVATWMFVDATIARFAVDVERRRLPAMLALAAVAPLLVAAVCRALPAAPPSLGWILTGLGALLWASASVLLAHQATGAGDDLAVGPRRRVLRTPEDPPDDARGPVAARRPKPADDDAPIPLD